MQGKGLTSGHNTKDRGRARSLFVVIPVRGVALERWLFGLAFAATCHAVHG